MPNHEPAEAHIANELRRRRLTFAQRRKHLDRLELAIAATRDETHFPRQRGRAELGVLLLAAAVLLCGFIVWTAVLDDGGATASPERADQPGTTMALGVSPTPLAEAAPVATPGYDAAAGVCHVSPIASDGLPSLPRSDTRYLRWYGNRDVGLWAAPLDFGAGLPAGWPRASSLWFAGAETTVSWYGAEGAVVVALERLDEPAVTSSVAALPGYGEIQDTAITLPAPGCWQLTAAAGEQELTLVVDALPLEQRPDIAYAESYNAARPYDIPDTCPVTTRTASGQRGMGHHWLQSGDIRAEFQDLLFAGKEQNVGVFGADVTAGFSLAARKLNTDADEHAEALTPLWNSDARLAIFSIPSAGCWELGLSTPTTVVTFVVYVYPAACEPELRDGAFVADCEAPRE